MSEKKYYLHLSENQVVLFADVIGFSNMIYENENISVEEDDGMICNLATFFNSRKKFFGDEEYQKSVGVKFTWVSDSIFMSCDLKNIDVLLDHLIDLQRNFVTFGFHLRGGFGVGRNYHKMNIWGPATVKAANLESHMAIYPRILIDNDDFEKLPLSENYKKSFRKDFDGLIYLNLFDLMIQEKKCDYPFIKSYINDIYKKYNDAENIKIQSKYGWLKKNIAQTLEQNRVIVDEIIMVSKEYKNKKANTIDDFIKLAVDDMFFER